MKNIRRMASMLLVALLVCVSAGAGFAASEMPEVQQRKVTKITIGKPAKPLRVGEKQRVAVKVYGTGMEPDKISGYIFAEGASAVEFTYEDGKFYVLPWTSGTTTLKMTIGKVKGTRKLTILDPVAEVRLSLQETTIKKGKSRTIKGTAIPAENEYDPDDIFGGEKCSQKLSWSSSDKKIATVKAGKVKGIRKGTVTITAKAENGIAAECIVTVN